MDGKHILVTGGSQGLGLGLVRALLEAGYQVSTLSRHQSPALCQLQESSNGRLRWYLADMAHTETLGAVVDEASEWAGGLYGLINNAGVARQGILATFPSVETETILDVNLKGAIEMARHASRVMLTQPNMQNKIRESLQSRGRIINVSSIIGQRGYTGLAAYAASKAGLDGLTRALSRELGRRGITVNSVAPGYLETEMSDTLTATQKNQIIRRTPLGRLGRIEDVIPLFLFLLSDAADFISGQVMTVDGGISV